MRLPGVSTSSFGTYIGCDARDPTAGNCLQNKDAVGSYRTLNINIDTLATAVEGAAGVPHLVPVYNSLSGRGGNRRAQVVGWAAFTIENVVEDTSSNSISLTGHFDKFFVDSSFLASKVEAGNNADFGVHAVGLID
jgi:hypothetical protein